MTTKSELRQSFVDQGWVVQPVADWLLVSTVDGIVKYDVNVVSPSPEYRFGTAQVVVTDNGGAAEEATPFGAFSPSEPSFDQAVREYAAGLEGATIFAVAITDVFPSDEVALATAYLATGAQAHYVVKRRNGTFTPLELTAV